MVTGRRGDAERAQGGGEDVGERAAAVVGQPERPGGHRVVVGDARQGIRRQRAVARDSAAAKPSTLATASAPSAASLTRSAMSSAEAVPV